MSDENGKVKPLTVTEKKVYEKLINSRRDTVMKALSNEVDGGGDQILEQLRMKAGITLTEEQYLELIEGIDDQIKAEVAEHIAHERQKIEVRMEDIEETYGDREKEMKRRHKEEWTSLGDEKKKEKASGRTELRNLETDLAKEHASDLLKKKIKYQRDMAIVKQKEAEVAAEARRQSTIITRSRGRLEDVIRDAAGRAVERLWFTEDKNAVKGLLELIPTVEELIEICNSEDGIANLFKRLNPNIQLLTGPSPEPQDDKPIDVDVEIIPTTMDDDDEEESDEGREYDHDEEVYGDTPRYRRNRR